MKLFLSILIIGFVCFPVFSQNRIEQSDEFNFFLNSTNLKLKSDLDRVRILFDLYPKQIKKFKKSFPNEYRKFLSAAYNNRSLKYEKEENYSLRINTDFSNLMSILKPDKKSIIKDYKFEFSFLGGMSHLKENLFFKVGKNVLIRSDYYWYILNLPEEVKTNTLYTLSTELSFYFFYFYEKDKKINLRAWYENSENSLLVKSGSNEFDQSKELLPNIINFYSDDFKSLDEFYTHLSGNGIEVKKHLSRNVTLNLKNTDGRLLSDFKKCNLVPKKDIYRKPKFKRKALVFSRRENSFITIRLAFKKYVAEGGPESRGIKFCLYNEDLSQVPKKKLNKFSKVYIMGEDWKESELVNGKKILQKYEKSIETIKYEVNGKEYIFSWNFNQSSKDDKSNVGTLVFKKTDSEDVFVTKCKGTPLSECGDFYSAVIIDWFGDINGDGEMEILYSTLLPGEETLKQL